MRQSSSTTVATRGSRDLDVFEFREEDENCEVYNHWSKIGNTKSDDIDDALTKYQFLQHASCGSVNQIKEVHTVEKVDIVALDDDERGLIDEALGGSPDLLQKACSKGPLALNAVADEVLEQYCCPIEGCIEPRNSLPQMKIKFCSRFVHGPQNCQISPSLLESHCLNGSVDIGASDGNYSFQERPSSSSASDMEENDVPIDRQVQDQFIGGLETDEMDLIVLQTIYTTYGDKYFPNSLILISRNSVKMKALDLEKDNATSSSEWRTEDILKIDSQWSSTGNFAKVRIRLLGKDAPEADNASGASGVQVLEFLVCGSHWSQQQERIMSLDVRYKAALSIAPYGRSSDGVSDSAEDREGCSDPYIPNFEETFEDVVYPKGDKDAVSICKSDVDLLQPEVFVNDTIIDFYITYLKNQIPSEERQRFHFFSSFFFRKLADLDKNPSSVSDGKAAFQRVRRWTRKVNLFEKDYIFIPVNYNLHWSLIVLCYPGEVANFSDENVDEALRVPCILHMDSIRGSHAGLKDLFQSYLWEEWKERQEETSEDLCAKFLNMRFLSLELPQQENCSDCGLFLLHYAELFIAEAPVNFSPFQINKFDNFLMPDWFMPAEASLKRVHIQRLIYELLGNYSGNNDSAAGNCLPQPSALPENNEIDNGIEIISESKGPSKSWIQNSLHAEPVQGMGLDLLDMPVYRTSHCVDNSGYRMAELLEQCQSYDQGFTMPNIREGEGNEHLALSTLGQTLLQSRDQVGDRECNIDYSSSDFGQEWKSEMSDQGNPDGNSSGDSEYASDDSGEGMSIIESDQEGQSTVLKQNETLDQLKTDVDSLTESYASASSDMMETPAEDSQELADRYGSNILQDPLPSNQEEVIEPSQEKLEKNGDKFGAGDNEKLVVEDSSPDSDEEQPTKTMQLTPSLDSRTPVKKTESEVVAGSDEKMVVEDSPSNSDEPQPAKRMRLTPSHYDGTPGEKTQCGMVELVAGGDEKVVVKGSPSNSDEEQPAKRMRLTTSLSDEKLPE